MRARRFGRGRAFLPGRDVRSVADDGTATHGHIENDWKYVDLRVQPLYTIGPVCILIGIFLYLAIDLENVRPTVRPIVEYLIYLTVVLLCIIAPLMYLFERAKILRYSVVKEYRFTGGGLEVITPKGMKIAVKFDDVLGIRYPNYGNFMEQYKMGYIKYMADGKMESVFFDPKNAYRVLLFYLEWARNRGDLDKVIIHNTTRTFFKLQEAVKSNRYQEFHDEFWKYQSEHPKEWWLTEEVENILKGIGCPYTLDELIRGCEVVME